MKQGYMIGVVFALVGLLIISSVALAQEEVLLYSQDFESGRPEGWDLGSVWAGSLQRFSWVWFGLINAEGD